MKSSWKNINNFRKAWSKHDGENTLQLSAVYFLRNLIQSEDEGVEPFQVAKWIYDQIGKKPSKVTLQEYWGWINEHIKSIKIIGTYPSPKTTTTKKVYYAVSNKKDFNKWFGHTDKYRQTKQIRNTNVETYVKLKKRPNAKKLEREMTVRQSKLTDM